MQTLTAQKAPERQSSDWLCQLDQSWAAASQLTPQLQAACDETTLTMKALHAGTQMMAVMAVITR